MTNSSPLAADPADTAPPDKRLVYDIEDVVELLGISERSVHVLIKSGQLKSYKVLRRRKIDRAAVRDYLESAVSL